MCIQALHQKALVYSSYDEVDMLLCATIYKESLVSSTMNSFQSFHVQYVLLSYFHGALSCILMPMQVKKTDWTSEHHLSQQ